MLQTSLQVVLLLPCDVSHRVVFVVACLTSLQVTPAVAIDTPTGAIEHSAESPSLNQNSSSVLLAGCGGSNVQFYGTGEGTTSVNAWIRGRLTLPIMDAGLTLPRQFTIKTTATVNWKGVPSSASTGNRFGRILN